MGRKIISKIVKASGIMCDTFHIAVGANHMFGGTNVASDHIDFVGHGVVVL